MNAEQIETLKKMGAEVVDFVIGFLLGVSLYHAVIVNNWL